MITHSCMVSIFYLQVGGLAIAGLLLFLYLKRRQILNDHEFFSSITFAVKLAVAIQIFNVLYTGVQLL